MSLPIVFMHRTDDNYLSYSLRQAQVSNPGSRIFLLGTALNQRFGTNGIQHVRLDAYMQTAAAFAPHYKHLHVMSHAYNLFCFQRWFILRDFMRSQQMTACCYIDSDVMLYENVNNPEYSQFMMEFVWTNFVKADLLDRFCSFTTMYFADPVMFEKLVQETKKLGHVSHDLPLVSDMVAGLLFLRQFPDYTYTHGRYGDKMFDENINRPLWAESLNGKRKVYLINGKLYTREMASHTFIRLNSLHFQGLEMKSYMPYFFTPHLSTQGMFMFDYLSQRWHPTGF